MDVPLSENGVRQSTRLGNWFAQNSDKPTIDLFCVKIIFAFGKKYYELHFF